MDIFGYLCYGVCIGQCFFDFSLAAWIDSDQLLHEKVYLAFGSWGSMYFHRQPKKYRGKDSGTKNAHIEKDLRGRMGFKAAIEKTRKSRNGNRSISPAKGSPPVREGGQEESCTTRVFKLRYPETHQSQAGRSFLISTDRTPESPMEPPSKHLGPDLSPNIASFEPARQRLTEIFDP